MLLRKMKDKDTKKLLHRRTLSSTDHDMLREKQATNLLTIKTAQSSQIENYGFNKRQTMQIENNLSSIQGVDETTSKRMDFD